MARRAPSAANIMRIGKSCDGLVVREMEARTVSSAFVSAWLDLEKRALEPNVYLSPHFVLPALRHLDPRASAIVLAVEGPPQRAGDTPRLVGLVVCERVLGTRGLPVPHLRAYQSRHSFLTGLLLDRELAAEALGALLDHLHAARSVWHGIEFESTWGDGPTHDLLVELGDRRRMRHRVWNEATRAVLEPRRDRQRIERAHRDEGHALRRRIRRLNERGQTTWKVICKGGIPEVSTEAFLALEHRGWKGDRGSSLRSTPAAERFFREVVAGFGAEDRAFFVELHLDEKVVATTSNFVSGQAGFAFKVGWLPELANVSPGRLTELELVSQLYRHDTLSNLDFLDSGAPEGSYIDALWPGRRPVVSLTLASSALGRWALLGVRTARLIRNYRARRAVSPAGGAPLAAAGARFARE